MTPVAELKRPIVCRLDQVETCLDTLGHVSSSFSLKIGVFLSIKWQWAGEGGREGVRGEEKRGEEAERGGGGIWE